MSFIIDQTEPTGRAATPANLYQRVQDFVLSLGYNASDELVRHAAATSHEDYDPLAEPRDHDSIKCMYESRGTATPAVSIYSTADHIPSLLPPVNFGAVLPNAIYRSSYPQESNFAFIRDLKIKSILTLVPEPISPEYQGFMKEAGIQHFQVHIKANKGEVRVDSCEMSRALRLLLDRTNHPILIHCNKGKHRTGCTVACFRRIIGADMDMIRDEYHMYAGPKARFLDEVFFENFDLNLVMWMARQEAWIAPEPTVPIVALSPAFASPATRAVARPVA